LLVAGPIERATHLLPQIKKERTFNYTNAVDGLRQILWGFFKKIVIADNFAQFSNEIFNNSFNYSGTALALGAIFFTIQIYGDFSGYSDIAIGTARLFGIELLRNFAFPYFSRDIAEFWRRWHISLSSWFRDYLYIPLGGSNGGNGMRIRNTIIIFLVSGFWHGANWTFIVWGALNALYIMPSIVLKKNRNNLETVSKGKLLPTIGDFFQMARTFSCIVFAWIIFRAENTGHAWQFVYDMLTGLFTKKGYIETFNTLYWTGITIHIILFLFVSIEWLGRERQYAISDLGLNWRRPFRHAFYYALMLLIFWYSVKEEQFIYFQF
jgi:alginate O-acetyltransferase complex protein AlgI